MLVIKNSISSGKRRVMGVLLAVERDGSWVFY